MESSLVSNIGYVNVGIDDGWNCGAGANKSFHGKGFSIGIQANFESKAMVEDVMSRQMGWYQNNCWCHGTQFLPSGGILRRTRLLRSRFDGVKIDGCGRRCTWICGCDLQLDLCSSGLPRQRLLSRGELPPVPTRVARSVRTFSHFRDIAPQFLSSMFNINFGQRLLAPYLDPALARPAAGPMATCFR